VGQIAGTLERLLLDADLRQSLSEKGRERSTHFSWEKASEMTLRILSEVAAE
jgi:glycosyltransferase involved in cell wall biosynthesis